MTRGRWAPLAAQARCLALLGLCSLLPACALLGSGKPPAAPQTYALDGGTAPALAAAPAAADAPVLLVQTPTAAAGFDSKHMVYERTPLQLEWFTQSNWVDTPARMLAPLLLQALQASGLFRAVLLAPSTARSDLRLDSEIVRLQQSFLQQPSQLRLTLQLTLTDSRTREVLAWRQLDVVQDCASEDARGGSAAASAAVQQALQQLSDFVRTWAHHTRPP